MELKLELTGIFVNTLVYVVYSLTPPSAIGGKWAGAPKSVYVCASDPVVGSLLEDQCGRSPSAAGVCHSLHCKYSTLGGKQLCLWFPWLLGTYHAQPSQGTEQERMDYALNNKRRVIRLVLQWAAMYGDLLQEDDVAMAFLEVCVCVCVGGHLI